MTYRLRIRRQAAHELLVASVWYEAARHGLGAGFLESFRDSIEILASSPRRYRMVRPGIRRALMRRFPYSIFYTVMDQAVHVLAVQHGHRDPGAWPEGVREATAAWAV